ncbi:MAG TPA: bifunctional serine/threonine-protein kinase/formylglycine-generating enzyme family protein [Thermoanaerobaculia bacterium]|nr:bifunctional serine/threonine-protein kinase/formylglycine-generating enzyme family protein [Thermoanaerobaculia bacterium]
MSELPGQIGQYRIERLLGEGGMGSVYLGVHKMLGSRAAIKTILEGVIDQKEAIPRLIDEGRALANLHDTNIVRVLDLFTENQKHYLVMEYVQGETLDRRLCRDALDVTEALDLAIQVGSGVASAHRQGILHRDIKPQNVMLDQAGSVKVMDFGLAKFADATTKTRTGILVGTPRYMSPEQLLAKPLDARSDQYSYGILVYRLLCGREPFIDGDPMSIAYQHINNPPASPVAYNKLVNPALAAVVLKSLSKNPDDRYVDMPDMLRDLRKVRETMPEAVVTFVQTVKMTPPRKSGIRLLTAIGFMAAALLLAWLLILLRSAPGTGPEAVSVAPPPPVISAAARSTNRWIWVTPVTPPVLMGLRVEAAAASVSGLRPSRAVRSPDAPYEIQQHEVTWGEIETYARENAMEINDGGELTPSDRLLPATGLPWLAALEYCRSMGSSLPTEAQWEFAARGAARRPYPWGDEPVDLSRTRVYGGPAARPQMVMSAMQDRTPGDPEQAIYDLLGNAQEWTMDRWIADSDSLPTAGPDENDGEIFNVVRGLPVGITSPREIPAEGAAARFPICGDGECITKYVAERQHIGFRCVKKSD